MNFAESFQNFNSRMDSIPSKPRPAPSARQTSKPAASQKSNTIVQPKVTRGSILTKRPQTQSGFQVPDAPAEAPKLNKRQSKASAKKKEAEEAAAAAEEEQL